MDDATPTGHVIQRDLVVVGTSAGGVEALQRLVAGLPPEMPASILVVLHMMSEGTSVLDAILARAGEMPVTVAIDGERLERGHVYVAPPNFHLLVRGDHAHLSAGPRENGHRPAIDPLFRSAARAYGPRAVGVVLTGTLDDGTDGLRMIKEHGGATVVQDPEDAAYPDMPRSAIDYVKPDHVAPLAAIPGVLCEIVDASLEVGEAEVADPSRQAIDLVEVEFGREPPEGDASLLTCPECGGVLMEREDGNLVRFACQVGHAYSPESLVEKQGTSLEGALWRAQRTLEERADLLRQMGTRASRRGDATIGRRFERRAETVEDHAAEIRRTIVRLGLDEDGDGVVPEVVT
jgi:two-component system chemotaxis response regulator CheB